eukprot:gene6459-4650_t
MIDQDLPRKLRALFYDASLRRPSVATFLQNLRTLLLSVEESSHSLVGGTPMLDDPAYLRCEPVAARNGFSFLLVATALANHLDGAHRSYTPGALREKIRREGLRTGEQLTVADVLRKWNFTVFSYGRGQQGQPAVLDTAPLPSSGRFLVEQSGDVSLPPVIEGFEFLLGSTRPENAENEGEISGIFSLTRSHEEASVGLYAFNAPLVNGPEGDLTSNVVNDLGIPPLISTACPLCEKGLQR